MRALKIYWNRGGKKVRKRQKKFIYRNEMGLNINWKLLQFVVTIWTVLYSVIASILYIGINRMIRDVLISQNHVCFIESPTLLFLSHSFLVSWKCSLNQKKVRNSFFVRFDSVRFGLGFIIFCKCKEFWDRACELRACVKHRQWMKLRIILSALMFIDLLPCDIQWARAKEKAIIIN